VGVGFSEGAITLFSTHDSSLKNNNGKISKEMASSAVVEESSEERPLLPSEPHQPSDPSTPSLNNLILYFMTIHFLLAFCQIILVAPLIRLFENSLCLTYYNFPIGGVQESLCKIPEIQKPLATIRGWKSTLDTIPVLLVAIPLGKYGDYYGRRRILALALVGVGASLVEIFTVCRWIENMEFQS
jgi:hypothetical protein